MTLFARPLTSLGDAAILLMRSALLDYEATSPRLLGFGRISRSSTALGTLDLGDARAQACMFRIVTIVEAYTDAALELMFRGTVPANSPAALRLLDAHLLDAAQRWDARKKSFLDHHALSLGDAKTGFPQWSKLDGMIEVRNAIAHGLGSLTRQQRKNAARSAGRCSQIGVRIDAGEVIVSPASLRTATDVAENFVRWLDARL
jgi:hypothetical protein